MGLSKSASDEAFSATGGGHETLSGHGGFERTGLLAAQQPGSQVCCPRPTVTASRSEEILTPWRIMSAWWP